MRDRTHDKARLALGVAAASALALGACSQGSPAATPTVTKAVTAAPSVLRLQPATSGQTLAAR